MRVILTFVVAMLIGLPSALACPDQQLYGSQHTFDTDKLRTTERLTVNAGGDIDLNTCSEIPGNGWVVAQPDFTISYEKTAQSDLIFKTEGTCDTVLLINDATNQWHFNDNIEGGQTSELKLENASDGYIDVWVGTVGKENCDATLLVTAEGPPHAIGAETESTEAVTCPDPELSGDVFTYTSDRLVTERRLKIIAGGDLELAKCNPTVPGNGWVINSPDFTVRYQKTEQANITMHTVGECDTVLLVNDASSKWHYDDDSAGEGSNAKLQLENAADGYIDIWVGTIAEENCDVFLVLKASQAN